jgi:hypothetical protein
MGLGRSIYTLSPREVEKFMRVCALALPSLARHCRCTESDRRSQVLYIGNAMYPISVTLIKLALLCQYLRVFEVGSRTRAFCKVMIVVTAAWGTAFIVLRWVPCYPVAAYWDYSIQDARCWAFGSRDPLSFMAVFVAQATSTVVLDFIVLGIPIQLYFRPGTQKNTKRWLLGLLVLGSMYATSDQFIPVCPPSRRYTVVTILLWQVYLVRDRSHGFCH